MKKLGIFLRWCFVSAALLFALLIFALWFYTRTEGFREMVREQLVSAINASMRGSLSLDRIEGSLLGNVTLHNVRIRYQDAPIITIPRLKISYALLPLLRGKLQVARAEAEKPALRLVRDAEGRWNFVEAFASDSAEKSGFAVNLNSLALRRAAIEINLAGAERRSYALKDLDLNGRLTMHPGGVVIEVSEVASRLQAQGWPELRLKGALAYRDTTLPATLQVNDLRLEHGSSRVALKGRIADLENMKIAAKVRLEKLAPADVAQLVPQWPLKHDLIGALELNGPLKSLDTTFELAAAEARVGGRLNVDVLSPSLRYQGKIQAAGIDGRKLFGSQSFTGIADGNIEVAGSGISLAGLAGSGKVNVQSAEIQGWALGKISLHGQVREGVATLAGDLESALGGAHWRGKIAFNKAPRYEMALAVNNLDIKKVSAHGNPLGGTLNFKGTVKGAGFRLADMNTRAELQILPSAIGPVNVTQGAVVAALAGGRIRVARATLNTADATLTVTGDLGTDLKQKGKLGYEFRSKDLSPWLALVGRRGSGSLTLAGRAQGSLADLQTRGTAKLAGFRLDETGLKDGTIDFDVARVSERPMPYGSLKFRLAGLHAGIPLQTLDATVKLLREPVDSMQIDAQAQDNFYRTHALSGSVDYRPPDIVARLSQVSLNLPDGAWKLVRPATVIKREQAFLVQQLVLRNGDRQLSLDGRVATTGNQALTLSIDHFPLEGLAAFLPRQPEVTGLLAVQAQISGTAAAPEINASARLSDSRIAGQTYAGMVADVAYKERRANWRITVRQDSAHNLTGTGVLPLSLSWHDGWRSEVTGDLDLRLQSAGLSLAFLNAFSGKAVTDLGGEISLDLSARGPLKEPLWSGRFHLRGGKLKAVPIGVEVSDITADGGLDSRAVKIQNFSARAKDGRITGSGAAAIKNYQLENFRLALAAKRWPAILTQRYQATLNGAARIEGSLGAPKLSGQIEIIEANVRPDLAFLKHGGTPVKRDETIVVVQNNRSPAARAAKTGDRDKPAQNELFEKLSLDVTVNAPGNVWIRHPDALAEVEGSIRASKKSGGDLGLTGVTRIVRGWVGFQGRRFNLTRGQLRFTGGAKINPALDIVAQYRLPNYRVDAVVGGTAEEPSLVLTSQPSLDQADILALLLFGKPTKELNRGEQESLQKNALDVTSGFVAAQIGTAVSQALGLDSLGVDIGELDTGGGRIGFGRYIGRKTYVSIAQELAGEKGREVSAEYRIAPDWKIGTSTNTRGSSGINIIWEKQY